MKFKTLIVNQSQGTTPSHLVNQGQKFSQWPRTSILLVSGKKLVFNEKKEKFEQFINYFNVSFFMSNVF